MKRYRVMSQKKMRSAFTLVELLVVIVIIALLSSLVAPKLFSKLDSAKVKTAVAQMQMLSQGLDSYRLDVGKYPTTQEGLAILWTKNSNVKNWDGPYLPKAVKADPWGNPYHYKQPGADSNPYDLYSLGSDGKKGGSGDAKDISVWE
ncbi:type II secretion system major pseudopilin GspG [Sulfurimonas sp. SWIR-19]|uniref:type II secretion system major pseudopilin GspG n=1 Tax=Sulfurimonas sp. SWIR-19 TaxID=2878390 RepID=UPI001CF51F1E|nr:type II secretion system major pseudopilin GspG [Sulfurimonas sp. SWIR-19]UCN00585.1 type II secretion system major pseudopilin GspG [Sulfurimonas sp. SWIR-19]